MCLCVGGGGRPTGDLMASWSATVWLKVGFACLGSSAETGGRAVKGAAQTQTRERHMAKPAVRRGSRTPTTGLSPRRRACSSSLATCGTARRVRRSSSTPDPVPDLAGDWRPDADRHERQQHPGTIAAACRVHGTPRRDCVGAASERTESDDLIHDLSVRGAGSGAGRVRADPLARLSGVRGALTLLGTNVSNALNAIATGL